MIAVIAGSTGLTGALLLSKLLLDSDISEVVALTRRSIEITHPKLKNVIVPDFSELLSRKAELKGDIYFSCLGTTIKEAKSKENFKKVDFDAVVDFGKIAEHFSAQSLCVISAAGANPKSSIFYNRTKGEAEEALLNLSLRHLILFRPGLLMGERRASRPFERMSIKITQALSHLLPEKSVKSFSTPIETLCERMLKEAKSTSRKITIINSSDI